MLRRALSGQRRPVALGGALVTIHQLAEVLVPVTVGAIVDRAVATGDTGSLLRWIALLVVQFVVLSAAGCTAVAIEERVSNAAAHEVRTAVARRVLHEAGGVESTRPGEVVSLSTVESQRVGEGVGAVILGIGAVTGVMAGAAILLATSWSLGLVVVIGLPVVLVVVQLLSQPLVDRADSHQEAVGQASGIAADLLSGLRVLKGLGAESAGAASYRRASAGALVAALAANRARASYAGFTLSIAGLFVILVAWLGGRQALDGTISIGQLIGALGVTQFLVGPLGRLAWTGEALAEARASSDRLGKALHAPPGVASGTASLPTFVHGSVSIRGLRHGTLDGVDLEVAPGELLGIVATDPADAAALVASLDRSVDPGAGEIRVDGVAVTDLRLDEARRAVVVAHHEAPLFEASVGAELAAAAAPDADLGRALEAAGADAVDGPLGEGGRSLSGGQRQRVALARALATDAPVLVLHEPTTAVDAATEHAVAGGIREVRAGRTTIVVAASPAILAVADRVVLLHEGRVVAEGTHAELAGAEPRYRSTVLA